MHIAQKSALKFTGTAARLQYHILMSLFRLAFDRRLFGVFTRALDSIFPGRNAVFLTLPGGGLYRVDLDDAYWTRFALFKRDYEPEVGQLLAAAAGHAALFCDLGANKGYWTLRASALFDHVIAVEAAGETSRRLRENARHLKGVTLHHAAIHARTGDTLTFVNTYRSHASAHLSSATPAGPEDGTETVTTVAIDDLVPQGRVALIKLDVEGAEIAAVRGASRSLRDGSVLIYEDHGADTTCETSAHLLNDPDMRLYSVQNGLKRLRTVADVRAVKSDPFRGYNFMAARAGSSLLTAVLEDFAKR